MASDPTIEKRFHSAMLSIYDQAKKLGYKPTYFLQMVQQHGGVEAAKMLLHDQNISYGFEKLWELKRLDLTVEAHVLQPEWNELFNDEDRKAARNKLAKLGYNVIKITELVPYEKHLDSKQYADALRDLKRDKTFDPPAKVFLIDGYTFTFVKDGHHHIRAALDLGYTEIPCVESSAPADWPAIVKDLDSHLRNKGFANLKIVSNRKDAIQKEMKEMNSLENNNELMEQFRKIAENKNKGNLSE